MKKSITYQTSGIIVFAIFQLTVLILGLATYGLILYLYHNIFAAMISVLADSLLVLGIITLFKIRFPMAPVAVNLFAVVAAFFIVASIASVQPLTGASLGCGIAIGIFIFIVSGFVPHLFDDQCLVKGKILTLMSFAQQIIFFGGLYLVSRLF